MKERPILMSAPMVRAILDGRKTQTRRLVKPQPMAVRHTDQGPVLMCHPPLQSFAMRCPYGQPGDRLWVKENFHLGAFVKEPHAQGAAIAYAEGKKTCFRHMTDAEMQRCRLKPDPRPWAESKTIPCLLMPRWASRITLEITGIRAERLQDISESDAWAEGIGRVGHPLEALFNVIFNFPKMNIGALALSMPKDFAYGDDPKFPSDRERITWVTARGVYAALWDSLNAEKGPGEHGYSWQGNPWVWVIEFQRI